MEKVTLQDLFPKDGKYTFLVGAGCSIDPPSCQPAGRQMMDAIIRYTCADSEIDKILTLQDLRYEQLNEILREIIDPQLHIIDYYGLCDKPNKIHFFLAEMIQQGNFVFTTNFDFLIEHALLQSGINKTKIKPIITKQDFSHFSDPNTLFQNETYPVYKIHGSTKNIVTDENTRDSLIATMQAFGSGKEGESVFQLEPYKRPLFENISKDRILVVMGYSGSDDFDIVPTLKRLSELKQIIWIDHASIGFSPTASEFTPDTRNEPENKIDKILHEINQMGNNVRLFRVNINTQEFLSHLSDQKWVISENSCSFDPNEFLKKIITSNAYFQYYIPHRIYLGLSLYEDAERCARKALDIAFTSDNLKWKSNALNNLGYVLQMQGEYQKAEEFFIKGLDIDENTQDQKSKAVHLNNIGQLYKMKGQFDKALTYVQEALMIAEKIGHSKYIAMYQNNIGAIYSNKGEYEKGLKFYNLALKTAEKLGDLKGRATYLNNIGLILQKKNQIDKALVNFQEVFRIAEQLSDFEMISGSLTNIGGIFQDNKDYENALKNYQNALRFSEKTGIIANQEIIFNKIGLLLRTLGRPNEALDYYKKALQISKQLENHRRQAEYLGNIGYLLWKDKKELDSALKTFQEALILDEKSEDLPGKATRLYVMGQIYLDKKDFHEAITCYKKSLETLTDLGENRRQAIVLNNIGSIFQDIKDLENSVLYYNKALTLYKEIGDWKGALTALTNLGRLLKSLNKLDESIESLQEALQLAVRIKDLKKQSELLQIIGILLCDKNEFSKALPCFEECIEIERRLEISTSKRRHTQKWIDFAKKNLQKGNP